MQLQADFSHSNFQMTQHFDRLTFSDGTAKAAAGDRNVMVHGADAAQCALEAGVLDEWQIDQIPVACGGGDDC